MIKRFEDMFEQQTEDQKAVLAKANDEAKAAVKAVGDSARSCINTEAFQSYKRDFERAQDKIVDAMIEYTQIFFSDDNGNIATYGAKMARYITKLQDLKALLTVVENDAKKGK